MMRVICSACNIGVDMQNNWTFTVCKNEYGEYVVRFSNNGKYYPAADYFTESRADAWATGAAECKRLNKV